jgi:hypothetical protein
MKGKIRKSINLKGKKLGSTRLTCNIGYKIMITLHIGNQERSRSSMHNNLISSNKIEKKSVKK